jgi:hypothetical protein
MNEQLSLDTASATAESPALLTPRRNTSLIAWVGSAERPEFIRQNELMQSHWKGCAVTVTTHVEPDKHHFNVIDDLSDADSPMLDAWLGL